MEMFCVCKGPVGRTGRLEALDTGFKRYNHGADRKRKGVGVILKAEYAKNVVKVKRVLDRVMSLRLVIEGAMMNVVSGCAAQGGCEMEDKERFWS